jgi:hypothetical protein
LLETDFAYTPIGSFNGKYSTLYGEGPEEIFIQFHNSARPEGLKRTFLSPRLNGNQTDTPVKMIREELFRHTDLAVRIEGNHRLIVLDKNSKPVNGDPDFNLIKRTSKLFTLEGYFRYTGYAADFYEINTRERWVVSKQGEYHYAIRQYHQLTKDKFEVTYIKAIGFSIQHTSEEGIPMDALVIKRVLQMTSSPTLTEEYNKVLAR